MPPSPVRGASIRAGHHTANVDRIVRERDHVRVEGRVVSPASPGTSADAIVITRRDGAGRHEVVASSSSTTLPRPDVPAAMGRDYTERCGFRLEAALPPDLPADAEIAVWIFDMRELTFHPIGQ